MSCPVCGCSQYVFGEKEPPIPQRPTPQRVGISTGPIETRVAMYPFLEMFTDDGNLVLSPNSLSVKKKNEDAISLVICKECGIMYNLNANKEVKRVKTKETEQDSKNKFRFLKEL